MILSLSQLKMFFFYKLYYIISEPRTTFADHSVKSAHREWTKMAGQKWMSTICTIGSKWTVENSPKWAGQSGRSEYVGSPTSFLAIHFPKYFRNHLQILKSWKRIWTWIHVFFKMTDTDADKLRTHVSAELCFVAVLLCLWMS